MGQEDPPIQSIDYCAHRYLRVKLEHQTVLVHLSITLNLSNKYDYDIYIDNDIM